MISISTLRLPFAWAVVAGTMPAAVVRGTMSVDNATRRRGNGYAIARDLTPRLFPVASLKPLGRETRRHPAAQVKKLAASLDRFGFVLPVVIDADQRVVAGWALILAALQLGLADVPAISITDLPEAELRVLRLALNRMSEDANWDRAALALEFGDIVTLAPSIELELTGFEIGEIDLGQAEAEAERATSAFDVVPAPVSRTGDLWLLGPHRVLCGDARAAESYAKVLNAGTADMVFATLPADEGFSGGPARADLATFLETCLRHAASSSTNGATHFVSVKWRCMGEMLAASAEVYGQLADLLIIEARKTDMRGVHRSDELIFVYKTNGAPARLSPSGGRGRTPDDRRARTMFVRDAGSGHPMPKSVAMIADLMDAYSKRLAVVLDPFGQAGATLMAAEHTGRLARVIEPNPGFVDSIVVRWQQLTGATAVNEATGVPFNGGPHAPSATIQ